MILYFFMIRDNTVFSANIHCTYINLGRGGGGGGGYSIQMSIQGSVADMGSIFSIIGTLMGCTFAYFHRILALLVWWCVANPQFFQNFSNVVCILVYNGSEIHPLPSKNRIESGIAMGPFVQNLQRRNSTQIQAEYPLPRVILFPVTLYPQLTDVLWVMVHVHIDVDSLIDMHCLFRGNIFIYAHWTKQTCAHLFNVSNIAVNCNILSLAWLCVVFSTLLSWIHPVLN